MHTRSFEAPGLLSGVLGVAFTGIMARKQLGLRQDVPCVAARRLQELEGGQAAAVPEPEAAADVALPHSQPVAGDAGQKEPAVGVRPVIELTAVSASSPAPQWTLQPQGGEGAADAAQGLLAALAASSPAKAETPPGYPRPDSAPAALEASELAELALEDEDGSGDEALLPARAARSHHSIGAFAGGRAAGSRPRAHSAAPTVGAAQGGKRGGNGSGGSNGAAGDVAYLSDRKELARRLSPWGAMLVVVAGTRVPYLQRSNGHELRLHLRSLGDFYLSSNLVLQFKDLCRWELGWSGVAGSDELRDRSPTCMAVPLPSNKPPSCFPPTPPARHASLPRRIGVNWSFPALYTPALLPFICVAVATLWVFRTSIPADKSWRDPFTAAAAKCRSVAPAIVGALILVAQMVQGGRQVGLVWEGRRQGGGVSIRFCCCLGGRSGLLLPCTCPEALPPCIFTRASLPPVPPAGPLFHHRLLAERVAELWIYWRQRE